MIRQCIECGDHFATMQPRRKTCSDECRHLRHVRTNRSWKLNNPEKVKAYRRSLTCKHLRQKRYREIQALLPGVIKPCIECRKPFELQKGRRLELCSEKCRRKRHVTFTLRWQKANPEKTREHTLKAVRKRRMSKLCSSHFCGAKISLESTFCFRCQNFLRWLFQYTARGTVRLPELNKILAALKPLSFKDREKYECLKQAKKARKALGAVRAKLYEQELQDVLTQLSQRV